MSSPSRRWALPPIAGALLALIGSLGLHLPAYVGLGVLKALLEDERPPPLSAPVEIEFIESRPTEEAVEQSPTEAPAVEEEATEPPRDRAPPPREPEREAEATPPPPPEEPRPEPAVAAQPPPPQARPEVSRRTSVTHRSRDPNVPPPDDAQFLAEQNSRVEEETIAEVRNNQTDDPEPQLAAQEEATDAPESGDASEQRSAEMRDVEGSSERTPTREEARLPDERPPQQRPSRSRTPTPSEAARGDEREGASDEAPSRPREAAGGGRQARGGGEQPMREVIIQDGTGSFRIRVPDERARGEGDGEGGGVAVAGEGRGHEGEGGASGRAGSGRRRARGGGRSGRGAPDLRVSWSQFSSLYGEEELQREREVWLEQRRSRTRGTSHQERWEQFRAAIENYTAQVRPGNQTALNTRADPFAAYLAEVHRRIHVRFADSFLRSLPSTVEEVFRGNPNMHAKLEIALSPDGRVARIGVIATSGDILFDFGAYNAVMRAQPFAASPEAIRSPDGLVYMHWSFYRNERQCGTFNAEPFILAGAPTGGAPAPLPQLGADAIFAPNSEPSRRDDARPRRDRPTVDSGGGPSEAPPPRAASDEHDHTD